MCFCSTVLPWNVTKFSFIITFVLEKLWCDSWTDRFLHCVRCLCSYIVEYSYTHTKKIHLDPDWRVAWVIISPAAAPSGRDHEKWPHHWGGVSNTADKRINFGHGLPPPPSSPPPPSPLFRGRTAHWGLIAPPSHRCFSLLPQKNAIHHDELCCVVSSSPLQWQREAAPLTPRPPWDLSVHTCPHGQGKHLPVTIYDTCTFNTASAHARPNLFPLEPTARRKTHPRRWKEIKNRKAQQIQLGRLLENYGGASVQVAPTVALTARRSRFSSGLRALPVGVASQIGCHSQRPTARIRLTGNWAKQIKNDL